MLSPPQGNDMENTSAIIASILFASPVFAATDKIIKTNSVEDIKTCGQEYFGG
jgi:hypothetical protein